MEQQLSFDDYRPVRSARVIAAALHNEEKIEGWSADAVAWIRAYSALHRTFVSEDCTDEGYRAGILHPPEPRAWGFAYRYCAHLDRAWIVKSEAAGWSKKRASPTILWLSQHPNFSSQD
ncbi:MAG: hypothetical protein V4477_16970 [Pseudomonadota bacterium]